MSQEDQAEQEKKKPWYKRWWVIAIVVVVGLVVVGSLLPEAEDDPEKPSASEPSPREPEPTPTPPPTVSAEELYQEREANATRYDLKYQGKWVQITGVVEGIDGGRVSLVAGGSFLSNVDLHDLSRQEQARADKGQEFTALCRVGNYILGTINLRDCRTAAMPTPTAMPEPTNATRPITPTPTTMDEVTNTPTPTTTPDPTATPEPVTMTLDCEDERFIEEIVTLSEDNESPFQGRILKLYEGSEELERTESVLRCKAEAKLSKGGDAYLIYHLEIDRDGEQFVGYEIGDPIASPTPEATATPPPPTPTPTPLPAGYTLNNPVEAGGVLQGSDGTEISVLEIIADARQQIAEENMFNDPPEEGNRFYMIRVDIVYPSGDESIRVREADFRLIGDNRLVYAPFDQTCGLIPDGLGGEIFGGGRIEGNICFEIPEDEAGLVLIHEPGFGSESRRFLSLEE